MRNKLFYILLGLIFVIAFALRFNKLGMIPTGFYQDESAIGYNAYSIMLTGKDEYGKYMPSYFKSFGDYKLPIYIYLTIIPIKIFGLNEFAVRFPSAFFGFLTVMVFYFFVKELSKNRNLAITSTAFLAVNPWSLDYNRGTFEVNIALFLYVLGGFFLQRAFNKKTKGLFIAGTICFIIGIYSYNLTRLLSFLLYILFILINKQHLKSIGKTEVILTAVSTILLLVPFLGTLFGNGGFSSASGTFIFSSAAVQAPLIEFRSYLIDLPSFYTKLFFNKLLLTLWQYFNNVTAYFSTSFFFVSGSSHGNHGIGNFGEFYLIELPFIILGINRIFKEKLRWGFVLIIWGITVILIASLTREIPHATRSFFLIAPVEILSAFGFLLTLNWRKNLKHYIYRFILVSVISLFALYNVIYYFTSYYVRFPVLYAKSWRLEDKTLSLYLKENEHKYSKIIFDRNAGFIYTSLLFYLPFSPSEFQGTVIREPDDSEGFSAVTSFGKYEFKDVKWPNDYKNNTNSLIITTADRKPNDIPPAKTFYYPKRPIVFSVKEKIMQYSIEEIAYVLVETK